MVQNLISSAQTNSTRNREAAATQRKPDITTAKRELDWEPVVSVTEGLEKTIAYFSRVLEESGEIIPTGQDAARPKPKVTGDA